MRRLNNRLKEQYALVLNCSNELSHQLGYLGKLASEALGYDVVADYCHGGEIEFRRVMEDGVADSDDTVRLEEILSKITTKKK